MSPELRDGSVAVDPDNFIQSQDANEPNSGETVWSDALGDRQSIRLIKFKFGRGPTHDLPPNWPVDNVGTVTSFFRMGSLSTYVASILGGVPTAWLTNMALSADDHDHEEDVDGGSVTYI